MKTRPSALSTALLAAALTAVAPFTAHAETADDAWQYQAAIYFWFPALGGDTSFPENSGGTSIDVSSQDVVNALKMAFMGNISAKKNEWGVWSDLVYADFGAKKNGTRDFTIDGNPVGNASANLKYDIKTWIWTVAGTYEIVKKPNYTADLLAGARYLDVTQTLDWGISGDISALPPISRNGSAEVSSQLWDGIIGVKGVADLGSEHKWFIPYYLDVGTGQSDLTWQVNAGIGYRYDWGALVATWRYLDYKMDSGNPIHSVNLNGPLIGAAFRW